MNLFKKIKIKNERKKAKLATENEFKRRFPNTKIIIKDLIYEELDYLDLGEYSYSGPIEAVFLGENHSKLKIGRFCSISEQVRILMGGQHPYKGLTTYPICPFIVQNYDEIYPGKIPYCKARKSLNISQTETSRQGGGGSSVEIKDDVWIGTRVTILGGVTIGQGAVIGAGALISKDVPPYSIVVGNNEILKYRFDKEIIDELLTFADYSKINIKKITEYAKFICTTELTKENVNEFRKFFK